MFRLSVIAFVLLVVLNAPTSAQSTVAHSQSPYVGGFEHQYRDQPEPGEMVAGGRLLLSELNCVSCHQAEDNAVAKPAPDLADVAGRSDPQFIMQYLQSPRQHQPRTTMPSVLWHLSEVEARQQAEALTHYLVSLSKTRFARVAPDHVAVDRGKQLYHSVGCVACHTPLSESGKTLPGSADRPFPSLMLKYSRDGLRGFLKQPHLIRSGGRMPDFLLSDREATDLAEYLVRDTFVPAAVNYSLFYGRRNGLRDRDRLTAYRTGITDGLHLNFPHRGNDFSVTLNAWLQVETSGNYEFHLATDDAGELTIDGESVIVNESIRPTHRVLNKSAAVELSAGLHEVVVEYFQRGRDARFDLQWTPPGEAKAEIPAKLLRNSKVRRQPRPTWALNEDLVPEGRRLFVSAGCADCHQLNGHQPRSHATLSAIADNVNSGCLAEDDRSAGTAPQFHLDARQRSAIRLALALNEPNRVTKASVRIHETMSRLQCYACHDRGIRDGVPLFGLPDDRRGWFEPQIPELGDEGRIPPSLTGVGDKLRSAWLRKVLTGSGVARPYVNVRMPQFGTRHVSHLVDDFAFADRIRSEIAQTPDNDEVAKAVGLHLVDRGRLQCIGCHDFNGHKSIGIRAMDLTTMPERLHRDWFHRYMRAPGDYRPGTKMPAAWPRGRSLFPQVLDGDANRQIDAIWRYLSDGRRAVPPSGLNRQSLEIIVGGEAVVYRNKIREAGFRGICVGYPDQVNAAFDAESMRLAQIWKGRFLNAGPHWNVQGMGRIGPIGHDIVTFPKGRVLTRLANSNQEWPDSEERDPLFQFRGYQLDRVRRPTFEYSYDGVQVTDFCQGELIAEQEDARRLVRTMTFGGSVRQLYVRVWAGTSVSRENDAWQCGEKLRIRSGSPALVVRESGGQTELLIDCSRLPATSESARITLEYLW